jgi:CHAD domain-containing protein
MTIDERSRHELYLRLEESLGAEAANTMMEHLPPVGWADVATKRDLDVLAAATKRDLEALSAATKRDLEALAVSTKTEIAALSAATKRDIDALAASTKTDIDALAAKTDALAVSTKKDLELAKADILGTLHAELTSQTRAMFLAIVTIVLTMSGLSFGLTFAALGH